jgi:hypothetical protein
VRSGKRKNADGLLIKPGAGSCRNSEGPMSNEAIRTRYDAFFVADFMPVIRQEQTQGAPERAAYAAEFGAYQLGQIDKKLGRLIELMEAAAAAAAPRG